MHGFINGARRRRQSARRHFRGGRRTAALRAFTGAHLYLNKWVPTLATAAGSCGSNIEYVRAAVVLLRGDDETLQTSVLTGHTSLLAAAAQVRRLVDLIAAYRNASSAQKAAAGRAVGIDMVWDEMIIPTITVEREKALAS